MEGTKQGRKGQERRKWGKKEREGEEKMGG